MDLEHELLAGLAWRRRGCDDDDVAFLPDTDLVPNAVYDTFLLVLVQGKVVEPAVGEAVAIIGGVLEA